MKTKLRQKLLKFALRLVAREIARNHYLYNMWHSVLTITFTRHLYIGTDYEKRAEVERNCGAAAHEFLNRLVTDHNKPL